MACFLVPAGEAIVTTVITKVVKAKEKKAEAESKFDTSKLETTGKIPFSRKMKWLNNLLWGGSALLAFEHIWHGEVVPWFPFLTNAANPESASEMLHEIATTGVTMAVLVTLFWLGMVAVSSVIEKRALKSATDKE